MLNIGVVGLGYVGLTLSIAASLKGINVYGVEKNQYIIESLNCDKAHFFEPELNNNIKDVKNKKFFYDYKFPNNINFDIFIITVGTPLIKGLRKTNFDYIKQSIETIAPYYNGNQLVILRSTVAVGTTRNMILPMLSQLSGKNQDDLLVCMCPERTIEGKAVMELEKLPQIIGGNNDKSIDFAKKLFEKITDKVICVKSLEEAELVKLYCNVYRDMTFSISNAFCLIAQQFGINGLDILSYANKNYSRSNIFLPGFVAGPCLEKDAYILTENIMDGVTKDFILNARAINESLEDATVNWVIDNVGPSTKVNKIVLSGMAFKGTPETSDLRGSSSVNIASKLYRLGYNLILHDFVANIKEMKYLNYGNVSSNLTDACKDASALLVLNNNKKYLDFQLDFVLDRKFYVLDIWNVCGKIHKTNNIIVDTCGSLIIR